MYNIVKGNAPISLKDLFVRSKELHEYDLRSSAVDLKLPLPHTEFLKRSLSFVEPNYGIVCPLSLRMLIVLSFLNPLLPSLIFNCLLYICIIC